MKKPSMPLSDLVISFSGLCLFVPYPALKKLYVFLVAARSGPPSMEHEPRLYVTNPKGAAACMNSYGSGFDLSGHTLDFSAIAYSPSMSSDITLTGDVAVVEGAPIPAVVGAIVPPNTLAPSIIACIVLPIGQPDSDPVGTFSYRGKKGSLAVCVRWKLEQIADPMDVQQILASIGAGDEPLASAPNQISLLVVNVPANELPGNSHPGATINYGDKPPHFRMFYQLTSATTWPEPTWADTKAGRIDPGVSCPGEPATRGSFIRCMVAQTAPLIAK